MGVDGDWGGGYKRGPAVVGRPVWSDGLGGLLIEIVWKGRDARAAARVADVCAFASVLEALLWVRTFGQTPSGASVMTDGPGINLRV